MSARPNFFIVGAPKCGTTALYAYLRQHPDVFAPDVKEPCFFGSDTYRPAHYSLTLDEYLALFAAAQGEAHIGEATTSYLASTRAAEEIAEFDPLARIIIMLRNPADQMHSFHAQLLYQGIEHLEHFPAALEDEASRRAMIASSDPPPIPQVLVYRDIARYADQVERYFTVFGRRSVHVIIFEEFARDPGRAYREVLLFLGADASFTPTFDVVNRYKAVRSRGLHEFLVHPPPPAQALVRSLVPKRARRRIVGRVRKLNTQAEQRPQIPSQLRLDIERDFASEVERLESLLERDLCFWHTGA